MEYGIGPVVAPMVVQPPPVIRIELLMLHVRVTQVILRLKLQQIPQQDVQREPTLILLLTALLFGIGAVLGSMEERIVRAVKRKLLHVIRRIRGITDHNQERQQQTAVLAETTRM